MRKVLLSIQTSSQNDFSPVLEIAALEVDDKKPTGSIFHSYLNVGEKLSKSAIDFTGLSYSFLAGKPSISEIAHELRQFIGDTDLVVLSRSTLSCLNGNLINAQLTPLSNSTEFLSDIYRVVRFKNKDEIGAYCDDLGISYDSNYKSSALISVELMAEIYQKI